MQFVIQALRIHCFGSNHLFPVDLRQAVNYESHTAWHRAGSTIEVVTDGLIPSCVLGECSAHIRLDFEKSTDMDQLPLYPLPSFCLHLFKKLVLDHSYRFNNILRGHWTKYTCFISIFNSGSVMSALAYCSLTHYTDTQLSSLPVWNVSILRKWLASQVFFQRCVLCWWYLVKALHNKHLCLLRPLLIYLV